MWNSKSLTLNVMQSMSGLLHASSASSVYLFTCSVFGICQAFTNTGSILNLAWTSDGTQVAGAGANGQICFGQLVGLTAEVGPMRAVLTDRNSVEMRHLLEETTDELDFRDRVIKMCLGECVRLAWLSSC